MMRSFYEKLPSGIKKNLIKVAKILSYVPFTEKYNHRKWVSNVYTDFTHNKVRSIFLGAAQFCHVNRPIEGYYFEFGCHGGNTMRLAYDSFHYLFNWKYVGFDSFEGLPVIMEHDKQEIWEKGKLSTSENDFIKSVVKNGMPREDLITVKGFYDDSLTEELKKKFLPNKAAVIYIDVDLYESAVPVLDWVKDFLQPGTILAFDDWNCFLGSPDHGERRAFREFREANPNLKFEKFVGTQMAQSFIFVGTEN